MRVIAGTARGRKIVAPPGLDVRPTSDRAREATFNALVHRGAVNGAVVVDLFAGSGALGIEALSRGAEHVTFVESDRTAHRCILDNIAHLGFGDQATVIRADATQWVRGMRERPDLVFADPPYKFGDWIPMLEALRPALAHDDAMIVLESGRDLDVGPGWTIVRQQRYGATVITLLVGETTPVVEVAPTKDTDPPTETDPVS